MYMPEHISGTGDAIAMPGMESFQMATSADDYQAIEAGHGQFYIPEEAIGSIYESADYMTFMNTLADQIGTDHCETDPILQIKTLRTQLRNMNQSLDRLLDDNAKRDRREQYIWAGLVGLAAITVISLFRK